MPNPTRPIPNIKKIIVLEDIDCMSNIVKKRTKDEISTELENKYKNTEKLKSDIYNETISLYLEDQDILTLSYILNIIDGICDFDDRLLIITTNRPEDLDEALIRPGRIDMQIHFQKCCKKITKQIIEFIYNTKIDINLFDNFIEYKYSPAELYQICLNSDFDTVIQKLNN
jgi:chaperone BCS1